MYTTSSNYRAELIKTIPNITLNQYNTIPSPPPLTTSYTSMTPVHFGSMLVDRDTPISGTDHGDYLEQCSEYNWLSENGSMNVTSLLDMPSTSQPDMEHSSFSSFSSHENSLDMFDHPDMFQFQTEQMDMSNGTNMDYTIPQDPTLEDMTPSMLTDYTTTPPEPVNEPAFVPKRKPRKRKVIFEPLGPEATVKQHLLQLGNHIELIKILKNAAVTANTIVNVPVAQETTMEPQLFQSDAQQEMRTDQEGAAVAAHMSHNVSFQHETDEERHDSQAESQVQQQMRTEQEAATGAANTANDMPFRQDTLTEMQFLGLESQQGMSKQWDEAVVAANFVPLAQATSTESQFFQTNAQGMMWRDLGEGALVANVPIQQETNTELQYLQLEPQQMMRADLAAATLANPMQPLSEASLEQYLLKLESGAQMMLLLREQTAAGMSVSFSLPPPQLESPLAPIRLPQLPLFPVAPPMYADMTPVPPRQPIAFPSEDSPKEKKKQAKPRRSRSGKPLGRPLGSFKKRPVSVQAPVALNIVPPIAMLPVIPQPIAPPIIPAPVVPKVIVPVSQPKPIVACPSLPCPSSDVEVHMCLWDSCGRQFTNDQAFYAHVHDHIIHHGNKLRVCYWDGCRRDLRPFDAYYKVQVHIRVHTKETPFQCDYPGCEKPFKRQDNLRNHLLTHSNQTLYKCSKCKKKFLEEDECRSHEKRAHLEKEQQMMKKRFACFSAGCDRRYSDFAGLKKHVTVLHPELLSALEATRGRFT